MANGTEVSLPPPRSWTAVQIHNRGNGPLADKTERDFVAAEHQAIGLGPEIAARFVVRSLERSDFAGMRSSTEQTRVMRHLLTRSEEHTSELQSQSNLV